MVIMFLNENEVLHCRCELIDKTDTSVYDQVVTKKRKKQNSSYRF